MNKIIIDELFDVDLEPKTTYKISLFFDTFTLGSATLFLGKKKLADYSSAGNHEILFVTQAGNTEKLSFVPNPPARFILGSVKLKKIIPQKNAPDLRYKLMRLDWIKKS
ncbi:MAG: hypothetical protein NUV78_03145 [Candidatus Zambryskibacteria bacterium]|nr:hypothetical protein [Candidatus Zambryskibacteria bacterium]